MYSVINILLLLFISFELCSCSTKEPIECNNDSYRKMDQLLLEISTFGDPNGKFPTNPTESAVYCGTDKKKLEWMREYTDNCITGLTKELMTVSMKDMTSVTNKYCDSPKLNKFLISWSKCGNRAINDTVKCWQNMVLNLERYSNQSDKIPQEDKTPLICCNYFRFDNCIEESMVTLGDEFCPTSSVDGLHSMVTEASGQSLNMFCGDYQSDSDKCDSINEKYSYLNEIQLKQINKSPLNPFIDIISKQQNTNTL